MQDLLYPILRPLAIYQKCSPRFNESGVSIIIREQSNLMALPININLNNIYHALNKLFDQNKFNYNKGIYIILNINTSSLIIRRYIKKYKGKYINKPLDICLSENDNIKLLLEQIKLEII